jgi:hypothetical protein
LWSWRRSTRTWEVSTDIDALHDPSCGCNGGGTAVSEIGSSPGM